MKQLMLAGLITTLSCFPVYAGGVQNKANAVYPASPTPNES